LEEEELLLSFTKVKGIWVQGLGTWEI
jgi:hypothetical protein